LCDSDAPGGIAIANAPARPAQPARQGMPIRQQVGHRGIIGPAARHAADLARATAAHPGRRLLLGARPARPGPASWSVVVA
jgi:hypothetical protein